MCPRTFALLIGISVFPVVCMEQTQSPTAPQLPKSQSLESLSRQIKNEDDELVKETTNLSLTDSQFLKKLHETMLKVAEIGHQPFGFKAVDTELKIRDGASRTGQTFYERTVKSTRVTYVLDSANVLLNTSLKTDDDKKDLSHKIDDQLTAVVNSIVSEEDMLQQIINANQSLLDVIKEYNLTKYEICFSELINIENAYNKYFRHVKPLVLSIYGTLKQNSMLAADNNGKEKCNIMPGVLEKIHTISNSFFARVIESQYIQALKSLDSMYLAKQIMNETRGQIKPPVKEKNDPRLPVPTELFKNQALMIELANTLHGMLPKKEEKKVDTNK